MLTENEIKKNRLIFLYEKKKKIEKRLPVTKHATKQLKETNEEITNLEKELKPIILGPI